MQDALILEDGIISSIRPIIPHHLNTKLPSTPSDVYHSHGHELN